MGIEVRHITKTFGAFTALRDVSLNVNDGELMALLGPSGSGKTTLLRIIAGLEVPDPAPDAALLFHDEDFAQRPVRDRGVGFVFQHYALFRHMSVFENVAFGLRVKHRSVRPSRSEIQDRVFSLLKLVQLDTMAARYPSQLSGGQRQRVALARALAVEPRVLLLDEPFGALDAKVRLELRQWLRRLHDELHVTSVFVTHDQEEALEVADRVVVMNEGRVVQVGTAEEVFHNPADEFVMNFLGNVNVFHGRVQSGKATLGPLQLDYAEHRSSKPIAARAFIRPYDLEVDDHANGRPSFPAVVRHVNAAGPRVKLTLTAGDEPPMQAEISLDRFRELDIRPGMTVYVSPRDLRLFIDSQDSGARVWSANSHLEPDADWRPPLEGP